MFCSLIHPQGTEQYLAHGKFSINVSVNGAHSVWVSWRSSSRERYWRKPPEAERGPVKRRTEGNGMGVRVMEDQRGPELSWVWRWHQG